MIIFASAITDPPLYDRCARRGIRRAVEPDSVVMANAASGSIFRSYNLLLDQAAARYDDFEAMVLLHQDAEIEDPAFCTKLRRALDDPDVGVVGCVGAVGVRSIAWWEGSVTWASFVHRYSELGGGDVTAFSWNGADPTPAYARLGEVDTIDGFVMGLSPWVVRNVRFDESLGSTLHGYDFDFCLSVRAAGKKIVTADFKVIHEHSLELLNDPEGWIEAHMRVAEKWDGRMPGVGHVAGDWKQRARRAEAEAAAARTQVMAEQLLSNARAKQLEDGMNVMAESLSWRITAPLRQLNAVRKRRSERAEKRPA
jgi:Glycosyltransferase like family